VPLAIVNLLRRVGSGPSPLVATHGSSASLLRTVPLAALLEGTELGLWSPGPRSIDELVEMVRDVRPETLIELGSGTTTVALAWAVRDTLGPGARARIVSVDQDPEYAAATTARLAEAGLDRDVRVISVPLVDQDVEGRQTCCYALVDDLATALDGRLADLVFIDGPAGPPGIRFGTLPLVRPYVRVGAPFVLDDALRDGELQIARDWADLPYVSIRGIRLIDHGLLIGSLRAS
jgi:predicted O-methyltransferase YrrM